MKKKLKQNPTKEKIITVGLELINEKLGSREVALREITRRVGCTAPNFYNYFTDLQDLFNQLRIFILETINTILFDLIEHEKNITQIFPRFIHSVIDFSLEHPGWYKFIHFEILSKKISVRVVEIEQQTENKSIEVILQLTGNTISKKQAKIIYCILHNYVIGDLSQVVTGRIPAEDLTGYKKKITDNFEVLLDSLIKKCSGV